ncbi:MAG: hypothetical protein RL038_250, partial [Actinomycetota bacterium]
AKGHRLMVGIRPLEMQNWLEVDEHRISELAEKAKLQSRLDAIHAVLDVAQPAVSEVYQLVLSNLAEFHDDVFEIDFDQKSILDKQRNIRSTAAKPLLALGEQLQEDFCIMSPYEGEWILSAAILYSPSRWQLLEKIGKNLNGIHTPVPEYENRLGKAVEQLFDRLEVGKPVWRTNWTILDNPINFQPAPPSLAERKQLTDLNLLDELHFRVERQTLLKLPITGHVVFTIRTYVNTLQELLLAKAENRELLLTNLQTTSDEHVEYRGWQEIKPRLIEYLQNK